MHSRSSSNPMNDCGSMEIEPHPNQDDASKFRKNLKKHASPLRAGCVSGRKLRQNNYVKECLDNAILRNI